MQLPLFLLLIACVSFAVIIPQNDLITASHDEFWTSPMYQLNIFFSRLENIIHRLKGSEGQRFATHIPYVNDPLSEAVSTAINSLNMPFIIEILGEGDELVIEAILEKGFKYCFNDWSRINLLEIPSPLMASFPIEFLPIEAFSVLSLDSVVECVLARVDGNKFKQFHSLILKLDPEFWKVPLVKENFNLRMLMTGFHLGTFEQYEIPNVTSENLCEIYPSPHWKVLNFILNLDILKKLETEISISEEVYNEIFRQFPFYFHVLQTFLHEILMSKRPAALQKHIIRKSVSLQETIGIRMEKFPEEAINLRKLKSFFSMRFSEDLNLPSFYNFFSISGSQLVPSDEVLGLLSPVINITNSEVVLNVFILSTSVSSYSNTLITDISNNLLANGIILEPFRNDSNLIFSFCNCLKRNRFITEGIIRNFGRSIARGRDVYILSRILESDFDHLRTILRGNERGIQMQLKFSTIFTGAFIDTTSISEDLESRLNYYKRAHLTAERTWALDQIPSSFEKFGAKMKRKMETCEDESIYRGRKRGLQEQENSETMAKALVENSLMIRNSQKILSANFYLPNISNESATSESTGTSDEYFYVNQLKPKRPCVDQTTGQVNFDKLKMECPEIRFIYSVLSAIARSMVFPAEKLNFSIEGSRVSGDGILKDSLATFGRLISLPKFKTVEYKEEVDGFVPLPLLCPNVMGFLGAWTALCLKHEIPLTWNFAPIFRKFLFRAQENENEVNFVDEMIETIYGNLFKTIYWRFEEDDKYNVEILPKIMKSHRMFNLPPPLRGSACPFLFENLFLESQETDNSLVSFLSCGIEVQKYLTLVKFSIKKHLYEGRDQFIRHFSVYFKPTFRKYLNYNLIDVFIGGSRVDPSDVSASLYFNGDEIPVRNDFEGEDEDGNVNEIYPLDLMKIFISKLTQEQVGKFLWFVTGSSGAPLNGFTDYRIAFNVKEAKGTEVFYSFARVCFHRFTLVIHERSAKKTFDEFLKSITFASGFATSEI